jgi:hypothetical protein
MPVWPPFMTSGITGSWQVYKSIPINLHLIYSVYKRAHKPVYRNIDNNRYSAPHSFVFIRSNKLTECKVTCSFGQRKICKKILENIFLFT